MTNEEAIAVLEEQSNFNRRFQHYFEASSVEIRKDKVVSPMLVAERYRELADALDVAISALRADGEKCDQNATEMRHGCKPLTMKQLREMDGQPVWVKVLDTRFNEENQWTICNADYQMVTLKDGFKLFFCGYESNWLAYTYPPAHIDREGWECPICNSYEVISFKAWKKPEQVIGVPFAQGGAMFCPHCGKPRTPEAWAELEKRIGAWV